MSDFEVNTLQQQRPRQVPLPSAKNRHLKFKWTQTETKHHTSFGPVGKLVSTSVKLQICNLCQGAYVFCRGRDEINIKLCCDVT